MADVEPTLLIVDDSEVNLDMLSRRLRKKGFNVLTVTTGGEALLTVSAQPVDLMVLDLMMPEMDGIEVLRRLRADPQSSEMPVIMATAKTDASEMVAAFDQGADDYVTKPIDLEVLVARIRALLRRRLPRPLDPAHSSPALAPVVLPISLMSPAPVDPPSAMSPVLPRGYIGVGAVLGGQYRLDAIIGSGGFGSVYRALNLTRNSSVAVKVLHAHLVSSQPVLRRFQIEGLSAYRVRHKNAVAVLDSGTTSAGIPYLVMELLEGLTLDAELANRGVLPFARSATIIAQVCDALIKAHASGIIHRDIKPANIHLSRLQGVEVVKVLDFGLAKLLEGQGAYISSGENLVGTPQFMAPERLVGKAADGRADVYSVGAMLYLMLTQALPYRRNTEESLISQAIKQINTAPILIKQLRPELPDEVALLIMSALAQSRSARPPLSDIKEGLLSWAERWVEPWPPFVGEIGSGSIDSGENLFVSIDEKPDQGKERG